ncbi:MAG: ATP-binding protein [Legionellales bacterium]|nr:ATP-binding protein [Legionellales bacterium]
MIHIKPYPRRVESLIQEALSDTPAVFIMGARQSGKTTLVKSLTDSTWRLLCH